MDSRFLRSFFPCAFFAALVCAAGAGASGSSREQAAAGAQVFASSGCTHCHGANGEGGDVGPSLLDVGRRLKPEAISTQIHDGGKVMPAFGNVLTDDQISQLVAFLRTKRAKSPKRHAQPAAQGAFR